MEENELTLGDLFGILREHLRLLIVVPLVCMVVVGAYSLTMPNEYTASTTMYVLVKNDGTSTAANTNSDLSASQMVTNDVSTLMSSDRVKLDAAAAVGLEDLDDFKLKTTSSTTTRIITLSVTGKDSQQAADVANAIVDVTSNISQSVMDLQSINAIDQAWASDNPSGPNRMLFVAVACVAGLFVAVAVSVLMETLNTKARSGEEVEELLGIPVVGHIPNAEGR